MMRNDEDPHSRVLYELSSMIVQLLRYPPPASVPFPAMCPPRIASSSSSVRRNNDFPALSQISPAAFASLFLGISLALMLFGSITFVIGFILMPWVIGLVLIFYFAGILSNLSELVRSILSWGLFPQDVPAIKNS